MTRFGIDQVGGKCTGITAEQAARFLLQASLAGNDASFDYRGWSLKPLADFGMQMTGGSGTIAHSFTQYREMGELLQEAIEQYHRRVPTRDVNKVIAEAQQRQPAGHGLRVLYALQGATDPPTFTLFANKELPATYLRYIERMLREGFQLGATPIKIRVRQRSN